LARGTSLKPDALAEAFGSKRYARIYSISQFNDIAGVAGAPVLMGWRFERFHDYWPAYLAIGIAASALKFLRTHPLTLPHGLNPV
jgi:hypothetical protein